MNAAREESTRLSYMYLVGRYKPKLELGYMYVYIPYLIPYISALDI